MEKCDGNLRQKLRNDKLDLGQRMNIANGIRAGLRYLEKVGIIHMDRKLANFQKVSPKRAARGAKILFY